MKKVITCISIFLVTLNLWSQEKNVLQANNLSGLELADDQLMPATISQMPVDSALLVRNIDQIMQMAIDSAAFPGAVILIAKEGKIFFHQPYGYHTYAKERKVKVSDLYDLASITKTAAATLALMKLYDQGKFDLDQKMGYYWPAIAKGVKNDLSMRDVLAHQGGLRPWIPYWSESQKNNGKYKRKTISKDSSKQYPYKISEGLYMHRDFVERKLKKMIRKSEVSEDKNYKYSGLIFYLIPDLVERLSGKSFDDFLDEEFYMPLGANTIGFNPSKRFDIERIVPTEIDTFFRKQILHGVVHDEGAALMLGVSGNAGLFSNAIDLAKVYQMLLNDGFYGKKRYLKASTIKEFTRVQFPENDNRRGLGFDKPLLVYDQNASSSAFGASPETFGHSGFTGTLVWADPTNDLLFIFLSNRVHPSRANRKIYTLGVRPAIHNTIYELFEAYEGKYSMGYRKNSN